MHGCIHSYIHIYEYSYLVSFVLEKQLVGEAATMCNSLARMENISDNVSSPDEETGLDGNSKLCIDVKYNIAAPDFSENISPSKEETACSWIAGQVRFVL